MYAASLIFTGFVLGFSAAVAFGIWSALKTRRNRATTAHSDRERLETARRYLHAIKSQTSLNAAQVIATKALKETTQ